MSGSPHAYELQGFRDRWRHLEFDRTVFEALYGDRLTREELSAVDDELSFVDSALVRWMKRREVRLGVTLVTERKAKVGQGPYYEISVQREDCDAAESWGSGEAAYTDFRSPIVECLRDIATDYLKLSPILKPFSSTPGHQDWSRVIGLEGMQELAFLLYDIRVIDGKTRWVERYGEDGMIRSKEQMKAAWASENVDADEEPQQAEETAVV